MASANPKARSQPLITWITTLQRRTAALYDRLLAPHRVHNFERLMVYLAITGYLSHLALIWACNNLEALAPLKVLIGSSYLSAIYTPFSFILLYEVLLLIVSLPESTTRAVGLQFEIISLITIRNVFKDLASFESLSRIETQTKELSNVLLDMGGGALLFLLVTAFYHVNRWRTSQEQQLTLPSPALEAFIERKKIVALGLSLLFFVLAGASAWSWLSESYARVALAGPPPRTLTTIFYTDFFTVMIFSDVLVLMLSLLLSDRYQFVFRNAGFVASTILLRIAIAAARPYDILVALVAVGFGIIVLSIYKYSSQIGTSH